MNNSDKNSKVKTWLIWTLLFVPIFTVSWFAVKKFGLFKVLPFLLAFTAAVLLYQRFVKKRSWQSILWGDQSSTK